MDAKETLDRMSRGLDQLRREGEARLKAQLRQSQERPEPLDPADLPPEERTPVQKIQGGLAGLEEAENKKRGTWSTSRR